MLSDVKRRRAGIQVLEDLDRLLDRFQIEAGLSLDDRQTIVLDVLEMILDEDADHVAMGRLGRQLQQQAFLEIAGADAGRIELLHARQRPTSPSAGR